MNDLVVRPVVLEPDAILPPARSVRLTVADHPVLVGRRVLELPEGLTVQEMVELAVPDPVYREHAIAFVKGRVIPRQWWSRIRLKESSHLELRVVAWGSGGGAKTLRTILMVAVIVLAYAIPYAGVVLGPTATAFLGTAIIGNLTVGVLLGTVVAVGGLIAINALVPIRPPKLDELSGAGGSPQLFIEGARNRSAPFAPIPVVLGRYRVTPPYGARPVTELIGGDQYLRMIFIWGIGPLDVDTSSIQVGATPLASFDNVETEHRFGFPGDAPLTLYSDTVVQDDISVVMTGGGTTTSPDIDDTRAGSFSTRTSGTDVSELGCDFVFPIGVSTILDSGRFVIHTIGIEIQFRQVGTTDWFRLETTKPGGGAYAVNINNAGDFYDANARSSGYLYVVPPFGGGSVTNGVPPPYQGNPLLSKGFNFQNATQDPWRVGVTWQPLVPNVQYEVRCRKSSPEMTDITGPGTFLDDVSWVTLKTITAVDPIQIQSGIHIAKSAIRIRATDQLNGVIDELSAVVTSLGPIWTGTSWAENQPTNNPASLFRLVLQGAGNATPLPDERLDLDALAEWYEFCEERNFTFNMVRDFASSVWETLADVAAAGRASPTQVDGKWSVVIERVQPYAVSHITPRNSFDFKMERVYLDPPHAWRTRFPNEEQDYRQDERRVYADGYTIANATRFEALELPGVTDPDQVFRLGRFRIAQAAVVVERWSFQQDMEFLTYRRGDRVAITHDVITTGLASARIKSITSGGGFDTAIEIDETVTMTAGSYGVAIRTVIGGQITRQVTTVVGDTNTLAFVSPVATGVLEVGNIVGFGVLGEETDDATVISIAPDVDFKARVACVPYRASIYDVDAETPTGFDTNLTPNPTVPRIVIQSVVTRFADRAEITIADLSHHIPFALRVTFSVVPFFSVGIDPSLARIEIQGRLFGTAQPYSYGVTIAEIAQTPTTITIIGPNRYEIWDFRLRWVVRSLNLVGEWTYVCGGGSVILGSSKASDPVSESTGNTGTDVTIPVPLGAGVTVGDLLLAVLSVSEYDSSVGDGLPFTVPAGWTSDQFARAGPDPGDGPAVIVYSHVVEEGDPAEWTWIAEVTGNSRSGVMLACRGVEVWDTGHSFGAFVTDGFEAPVGSIVVGVLAVSPIGTNGNTEEITAVSPMLLYQQHVSTGSATSIPSAVGVAATDTLLVDEDHIVLPEAYQLRHPEVDPVDGSGADHAFIIVTLAPTGPSGPHGSDTPCQFVITPNNPIL